MVCIVGDPEKLFLISESSGKCFAISEVFPKGFRLSLACSRGLRFAVCRMSSTVICRYVVKSNGCFRGCRKFSKPFCDFRKGCQSVSVVDQPRFPQNTFGFLTRNKYDIDVNKLCVEFARLACYNSS